MSRPGVVLILMDAEGRYLVAAHDFNDGYPGGFTLEEAQRMRARRKLAIEFLRAYSSPTLLGLIDQYAADRIVDELLRKGGKIREIAVPGEESGE